MWEILKEIHHRQRTINKVRILILGEMLLLGIHPPMSYVIPSVQQQGVIVLTLYFMFLLDSKITKSGENDFLS